MNSKNWNLNKKKVGGRGGEDQTLKLKDVFYEQPQKPFAWGAELIEIQIYVLFFNSPKISK